MPTLSPEEIAGALTQGRFSTPPEAIYRRVRRHLDRMRRSGAAAATDSPESQALRELIGPRLALVYAARRGALERCDIFVVPMEPCIAYAELRGDTRRIVVSTGQLNLMAASISLIVIDSALPDALAQIFPFDHIPTLSVKAGTTIMLFMLLMRAHSEGEPLPALDRLLGPEGENRVRRFFRGAALFTLLHELGHLERGHFAAGESRAEQMDLLLSQDISGYQQQEFEADAFALDSLASSEEGLGIAWMHMALEFFSHRETMISERAATHPVTLNRLAHAHSTAGDSLPEGEREKMARHFGAQADRFGKIETANETMAAMKLLPLPESLSRQTLITTLEKLGTFLETARIDLTPVLREDVASWDYFADSGHQ